MEGKVGTFNETWQDCDKCVHNDECQELRFDPTLRVEISNCTVYCEDYKKEEK